MTTPATTSSSDLTALLDALRDPDRDGDDTLRGAIADWLDENADERVPCPKCRIYARIDEVLEQHAQGVPDREECRTCLGRGTVLADASRAERAELIRVQVELAGMTDVPKCDFGIGTSRTCEHCGIPDCPAFPFHQARDALRARERELLTANPSWAPPCGCNVRHGMTYDGLGAVNCPACKGTGSATVEWDRGFVVRVEVPSLDAVLTQCKSIRHVWPLGSGWQNDKDCKVCKATGYTRTPYADSLLADLPGLRGVLPKNLEPYRTGAGFYRWWREDPSNPNSSLPGPVYDAMHELVVPEGGWPRTPGEAIAIMARAVWLTLADLPGAKA